MFVPCRIRGYEVEKRPGRGVGRARMAPLPHALIPALPLTPTPPSHTLTPTHSRRATATSDAGGTPPAPTPAVAALTGEPAGDDDDSAPPPSSCTTTARHALPSGTAWLAATIRHAGLPGLTRRARLT